MEKISSTMASMPLAREPANYNEVSMQQCVLFSDSLKDLRNLRQQLYSAAEYFELSCTNDYQKQIVVNTLKDYAIKALVNTVDHLGSVTYKVNDLLDERSVKLLKQSSRFLALSRLRTCREYIDKEGLSQQSVIDTPKYHKRYILPAVRPTIRETPSAMIGKMQSPSPTPQPSQKPGKFTLSATMPKRESDKRTVSPNRFPLLRSGSFASRPTTPKSSQPSTPNRSRPTTPNPSFGRQQYHSQPQKSASLQFPAERVNPKDIEQNPSKSKRLLKALLSRRKSKMPYT